MGVSIIFVDGQQRVLLYLRDNKPGISYPGCWDLLGGQIEPGELPQNTIRREVFEEIEFILNEPQLFNVYEMGDRIEHTYWAKQEFDLSTTPLHEGQRLRWFSESEINNLQDDQVGFGFKRILEDFYRKRPWRQCPF